MKSFCNIISNSKNEGEKILKDIDIMDIKKINDNLYFVFFNYNIQNAIVYMNLDYQFANCYVINIRNVKREFDTLHIINIYFEYSSVHGPKIDENHFPRRKRMYLILEWFKNLIDTFPDNTKGKFDVINKLNTKLKNYNLS